MKGVAFPYRILLRVDGHPEAVPALTIQNNVVPRILGREGVFSRLLIIFDEAKRRSGFARLTFRDKNFFEEHLWRHLESPPDY